MLWIEEDFVGRLSPRPGDETVPWSVDVSMNILEVSIGFILQYYTWCLTFTVGDYSVSVWEPKLE